MKYRYCDDQNAVMQAKNNDYYLELDFNLDDDEILIIPTDTYVYYERDSHYYTRKCFVADGISKAEVGIINELLDVYREMCDVFEKLNHYPGVSYEKYVNEITILTTRIVNRGHISEDEKNCLIDIFTGKKSKKELINSGKFTEKTIFNAYLRFVNELEWCYDVNRKWLLDIIHSFWLGCMEFSYSPQLFQAEYKIDKLIIDDILSKISRCKKVFTEEEKNDFIEYTERFMRSGDFTQDEMMRVNDLSFKLKTFIEDEYDAAYTEFAKSFIDKGLTESIKIWEHCHEYGYDLEVIRYIEKLGVRVEFQHRRRSRDRLRDYLE